MKQRFEVLDVFRGLFALVVAIYHFKAAGTVSHIPLIKNGGHFVDFFFVLSGFIIYHNYFQLRIDGQLRFMINRVNRLYPLHVIMLLLFLGFEVAKMILFQYGLFKSPAFGSNNLTSFVSSFFLLQSFNLAPVSWNYPSWSISAEMVTYLVFCLTVVYINRFTSRTRQVCFLAISAVALLALTQFDRGIILQQTTDWSMIRCIYGFFIGCFVYELFLLAKTLIKPTMATLLEITGLFSSLLAVSFLPANIAFLLPLIFGFCVFSFSFEGGRLSSLFNNRTLRRIGGLSYSIYMVHALVAIVFEIILLNILHIKHTLLLSLLLPIYLLTVLIVSHFSNTYIERKIGYRKKDKSLSEAKTASLPSITAPNQPIIEPSM